MNKARVKYLLPIVISVIFFLFSVHLQGGGGGFVPAITGHSFNKLPATTLLNFGKLSYKEKVIVKTFKRFTHSHTQSGSAIRRLSMFRVLVFPEFIAEISKYQMPFFTRQHEFLFRLNPF